jgi:signal transduction histidine kinase
MTPDARTDDASTIALRPPAKQRSSARAALVDAARRVRLGLWGIRTRILIWYLVLLAVSIAIAVIGVRQVLLIRLEDDIDAALAQEVEEVRALADGIDPETGEPFGGDTAAIFDTFLVRSVPGDQEAFFTLVDGQPYKRTVAPLSLFDEPETLAAWQGLAEPTWGSTSTSAGPVRWLAVPLISADGVAGTFAVAHYSVEERDQIDLAIQVMIVLSIGVLLLATVLAWAAAGRAIAPLTALTATARGIGERDLSARIPVVGHDEVAELTATLNSMLERLEMAFASQRAFLNDVGHELRTPITIIRGHLELLDDDPDERRRTVALVLDELDRFGRLVADLLTIARAEQPDFLRVAPLEVVEFLDRVAAQVQPLGERHWSVVARQPAVVVADPDRLTQALVNLAANAVRHTVPGSVIELGAAVEGANVRFWVRDEGTGVAPEDRARIFERFTRGRDRLTGSSEGAGLGLAIVNAIAVAHGGRTELESTLGRGSTFSIVIPLSRTAEEQP